MRPGSRADVIAEEWSVVVSDLTLMKKDAAYALRDLFYALRDGVRTALHGEPCRMIFRPGYGSSGVARGVLTPDENTIRLLREALTRTGVIAA